MWANKTKVSLHHMYTNTHALTKVHSAQSTGSAPTDTMLAEQNVPKFYWIATLTRGLPSYSMRRKTLFSKHPVDFINTWRSA